MSKPMAITMETELFRFDCVIDEENARELLESMVKTYGKEWVKDYTLKIVNDCKGS